MAIFCSQVPYSKVSEMIKRVVIFTGAGSSAKSGIPTFRDKGGVWARYDIDKVCKKGCLAKNREETLSFYDMLRKDLKDKKPNIAHNKLVEIKKMYPDNIKIFTQNVDDLFEKAGCEDIVHLHGFLRNIRCRKCDYSEDIGYSSQDRNKRCPNCGSTLRPDVVFFGEKAPKYRVLETALLFCDALVVIGTSGQVLNPLKFCGKKLTLSILCNKKPSTFLPEHNFTHVFYGDITDKIDTIYYIIESFIKE